MKVVDFLKEASVLSQVVEMAEKIINSPMEALPSSKQFQAESIKADIAFVYLKCINWNLEEFHDEHLKALRELKEKVSSYEQIVRNF